MKFNLYHHPDGGAIEFDAHALQIILTDENDKQTTLPIGVHGLERLGQDCQELATVFIQAQQRGDSA